MSRTGRQKEPRIADPTPYSEQLFRRSRRGGVYFVLSGDYVKIGVSEHVRRRVQNAAMAWNPHAVKVLGWIHEPDCEAAQILERRLHQQFARIRHRLEWFHATDELLAFIAANAKPLENK